MFNALRPSRHVRYIFPDTLWPVTRYVRTCSCTAALKRRRPPCRAFSAREQRVAAVYRRRFLLFLPTAKSSYAGRRHGELERVTSRRAQVERVYACGVYGDVCGSREHMSTEWGEPTCGLLQKCKIPILIALYIAFSRLFACAALPPPSCAGCTGSNGRLPRSAVSQASYLATSNTADGNAAGQMSGI